MNPPAPSEPPTLPALARALDVDSEDLIEDEDDAAWPYDDDTRGPRR